MHTYTARVGRSFRATTVGWWLVVPEPPELWRWVVEWVVVVVVVDVVVVCGWPRGSSTPSA